MLKKVVKLSALFVFLVGVAIFSVGCGNSPVASQSSGAGIKENLESLPIKKWQCVQNKMVIKETMSKAGKNTYSMNIPGGGSYGFTVCRWDSREFYGFVPLKDGIEQYNFGWYGNALGPSVVRFHDSKHPGVPSHCTEFTFDRKSNERIFDPFTITVSYWICTYGYIQCQK